MPTVSRRFVLLVAVVLLAGPAGAVERTRVWQTFGAVRVRAEAPIPEEVTNPTQRLALCREAALSMGQDALLGHLLAKKARSGKTLAEAEIPSLELQNRIRGTVMGVEVLNTTWAEDACRVELSLPKRRLRPLLRRN